MSRGQWFEKILEVFCSTYSSNWRSFVIPGCQKITYNAMCPLTDLKFFNSDLISRCAQLDSVSLMIFVVYKTSFSKPRPEKSKNNFTWKKNKRLKRSGKLSKIVLRMSDMLRERLHEEFSNRLSNRKSDSSNSDESVSSAFSEVNFEELGKLKYIKSFWFLSRIIYPIHNKFLKNLKLKYL